MEHKRKKRILWVGEFSELSTGYSIYAKNILSRLQKYNKFEIAEFAAYVNPFTDPRIQNVNWKIYCNMPHPQDKQALKTYNSTPINQFGAWRFEEVLLDFKCDVVFGIRDAWMQGFVCESPLKNYYSHIWNAPVDSIPQALEWISMMINECDAVLTYTDWAQEKLKTEGGGLINLQGTAPPSVDHNLFKPIVNKKELKQFYGLDPNIFIIGTVMRNQKRKLFPDLFQAFEQFIQKCKNNKNDTLAEKTYLYCHTSYPDLGWDLPRLLKESSISNKILFTYVCGNPQCNFVFPSVFAGAVQVCPKCNSLSAGLPNVQTNMPHEILAQLYNLMDVYVQYMIAEGLAIPIIEAAAFSIPVMATNYSAPESILPKLKGTPIKVKRMFRESETHAWRAYPDNDHLVEELYKFFQLPESIRKKKGFDAHNGAKKYFNWDKVVEKWIQLFDQLPYGKWDSPPNLKQPNTQIPNIPNNSDFVEWCILNILQEPQLLHSYFYTKQVRNLDWHHQQTGFGGLYLSDFSLLGTKAEWEEFDRNKLIKQFLERVNKHNYWEQRRCGLKKEPIPDFIQIANKS